MPGQISGLAVAYTTAGLVLVLSGFRNDTISETLSSLLRGQLPPDKSTGAPEIGIQTEGTPGAGSVAGNSFATGSIAQIAESYVGKLTYVYGGPPPPGTVDCSSFSSKVLNQAGIQNPGGSAFDANTHGPTTVSYLTWSGATTVGNSASQAQSGDLCVWQTHMGIAVGNGEMVSALNPQLGVKQTTIAGGAPPGELLFVRRLKQAAPTSAQTGKSQVPGSAGS